MNAAAAVAASLALAGASLSAVLAAAESSLVTTDPEPPSSPRADAGRVIARERQYRALAFARMGTQLGTGAAAAVALRALELPAWVALGIGVLAATDVPDA